MNNTFLHWFSPKETTTVTTMAVTTTALGSQTTQTSVKTLNTAGTTTEDRSSTTVTSTTPADTDSKHKLEQSYLRERFLS